VTPVDADTDRPPFVVGVGASAGGLEALQQLFEKTRATGGFAFVVIQHLSPDFESVMGELLAPHTPLTVGRQGDLGDGAGSPRTVSASSGSRFDRHILKPVEPSALFRVLREVSPGIDQLS